MKFFAVLFRTSIIAALMGLMFGAVAADKCPLCAAAEEGDLAEIKLLLDLGVDVNAATDEGSTALMYATANGHPEVAKMLISSGANPNMVKDGGGTALMFAAGEGDSEVVKRLLSAGANLNAASDEGDTALMFAALTGHSKIVEQILSAGANPNTINHHGDTALMFAAAKGHTKIVQMLLSAGANPDLQDKSGKTAWDYAEGKRVMLAVMEKAVNEKHGIDLSPSETPEERSLPQVRQPQNTAAHVFKKVWRSIVVIKQGYSQGSGVIVRRNVVATNCHVVDGYGGIFVFKPNSPQGSADKPLKAEIIKSNIGHDFCLLKVRRLRGNSVKLRRYKTLVVGEKVYAVGAPNGLELSISDGIISQFRKYRKVPYIQTDAAISPGSSGGGLFDLAGNLVGITTSKSVGKHVEGIGFAIPADLIRR